MARQKILVVDDEEDLVELITFNFGRQGFDVLGAFTGEDGLEKAREHLPDLIVLDLMLPGVDGLDVCRSLKSQVSTKDIPVIILSARDDEADIICGLELGADDYLTKPFSPRVLAARVRAVLRRKASPSGADVHSPLFIEDIEINPRTLQVLVKGSPIELTFTEFRILHSLARSPGFVFTRQQIVSNVHGQGHPVTNRSIDVQVAGVRRKLGPCAHYIETVRGVGYKMRSTESVETEAELQLV